MLPAAFRAIALLEAFTWAGLLVGMLFKYVLGGDTLGVRIFGPLHGAAFVAYIPVTLLCAWRCRWSLGATALGVLAAFPPMGTLLFERWVLRTGRLSPPTTEP
ncbi:MAG: DUF3817 domain-containing protein [Sandaracinaceae bacterium]